MVLVLTGDESIPIMIEGLVSLGLERPPCGPRTNMI